MPIPNPNSGTPSQSTGDVPVVDVCNVGKVYQRLSPFRRRTAAPGSDATVALRDISFSVRRGETVGLLGPNGAGKTTMMKIIATLLYPSSGRVLFNGHDVFRDPMAVRGRLGLVACDERSFYWRLTGRHNLSFFATLYGLKKRQAAERIDMLLGVLGLSAAADRPYHGYSSGMKQKLSIARGLLSNPDVVLYDEPTRSLDPVSTQSIRKWIVENRTRSPHQTHFIATNQLDEAEQLCDRVLIINGGLLIAHGSIQEIRDRWHRREYDVHRVQCRGFASNGLMTPDSESGLFELVEENRSDDVLTLRMRTAKDSQALSRVLDAILRSGGTIVRCETEKVPFDEVFCSLVLGESTDSKCAEEVQL